MTGTRGIDKEPDQRAGTVRARRHTEKRRITPEPWTDSGFRSEVGSSRRHGYQSRPSGGLRLARKLGGTADPHLISCAPVPAAFRGRERFLLLAPPYKAAWHPGAPPAMQRSKTVAKNPYKSTMNLPKTSFSMKANLAQNEPKRLAAWEENKVYEQVLKANEGHDSFILHDGPPYANGPIHIGHAFNKILKDIIIRYHSQRGFYTPYVPGWDCHGQPIEHMVEDKLGPEKMKKIDQVTLRRLCHEWADKYIDIQRNGFKRLGVRGEWDNPYLTYTHEYEAGIVEIFKRLYLDGQIYVGRKPVHWCTHCHTAEAEAEIEYGDEVSPSIFVKFDFLDDEAPVPFTQALADANDRSRLRLVIWTTTPWTLPANTAVCLKADAEYVAVLADGEAYVMAEALVSQVAEAAGWEEGSYRLLADAQGRTVRMRGDELVGTHYHEPIFPEDAGVVIVGDHVTLDTGTGCVHTAPGHGLDDYVVAQRFGVPTKMPVDDNGFFTKDGGPWAGKSAVASNEDIIAWLDERGMLLARQDLSHSYPHCWRCHEPVIFRATTQWFVSMDDNGFRDKALEAIEQQVTWYPARSHNRIEAMVSERPDWCISRQRAWGVPIPVFHCADCGEIVATEETFDAVIKLFSREGSDAWFAKDPSEYLPVGCSCPSCGSTRLVPDKNILDVWWESGVSHTSVLEARPYLRRPADVYLEGSDQHRGWFQSSLLTSVGAYGEAPYKNVISCGFTVDANGEKMSKSKGNGIDPAEVTSSFGADVLRLWAFSVDYSQDVSIDMQNILPRTADAYRRIRNTFRFLLGNLSDFDPAKDGVAWEDLEEFDRWALARVHELNRQVTSDYEGFSFHTAFRKLFDYIVGDLSSVYLDALKDRLYSEAPSSPRRRSAQTVLNNVLQVLLRLYGPVLVFTVDEVWESMTPELRGAGAPAFADLMGWVDEEDFNPAVPAPEAEQLLADFQAVLAAREAVTKALEDARTSGLVGKSQEANVTLTGGQGMLELGACSPQTLRELFIVNDVTLEPQAGDAELQVTVEQATGDVCPRCWNIRELGGNPAHPHVCQRCGDVLDELGAPDPLNE